MTDYDSNLPDQKELEREIGEYLTRKYGRKVKIVSSGLFPMVDQEAGGAGPLPAKNARQFHFDITPEELIAYLDQYVVQQQEAKAILATKICTHFNRISYALQHPRQAKRNVGQIKNNVLMMGPTGVGKTFLIKLIAQRIGVPFVKGDATKFSETGYVGGDVEDLVRDLVRQADGDIERAQYGIIYVDEIDKIAASEYRLGADVSRTGVQRALLKPMEETEVEMKVPHDPISQIEAIEHFRATGKREKRSINTRNILFIMSGAFAGLDEIIRKRVQQQTIGFEKAVHSPKDAGKFLNKVKAEDLIQFGFESEFVGRLPVLTVLDELSADDLYAVLLNPNSSVTVGKKQDFRAYGINIQFEDAALREIAERAFGERTGARGLSSVMERTLLHFEKKLPSTPIRHLVVSLDMVRNPKAELMRLLDDPACQDLHRERYEVLEHVEYKRLVDFILERMGDYLETNEVLATPSRLAMMARQAQAEDLDPREVCDLFIRLVRRILACAKTISAKCGLAVSFDDDAIDRILAKEPRDEATIGQICDATLQAMEYGLRLLSQKKESSGVVINAQGIDAPDKFINDLVSKAFKVE